MTRNLNPFFEALIDDLSRDLDTRYLEFLKAKPRTWVWQNLIFDVESLDSYYSCPGCVRRKPRAFCCRGYEVELTRHDIESLEKNLVGLLADYPILARRIGQNSFWRYGESFERLLLRQKNDDCLFLMPGARGCYLHAWALRHKFDPLTVKPYVCSLYPVVVIVIEGEVVITTFNSESKVILDSGERAVSCTRRTGRQSSHTFLQADPLLVRMFGEKVIRRLREKVFDR